MKFQFKSTILSGLVVGLMFMPFAHSAPKKPATSKPKVEKAKTAQECKMYTDRIDYQIGILKKRFKDLEEDIHGLYARHKAERNKHPIYGSYEGHIRKYNMEQKTLKQYLYEATSNQCGQFISAEARVWEVKSAPTKPNRPK